MARAISVALCRSSAAPVVASCGTALTPQQAHLLRRFTNRVILSFDPDAAGLLVQAESLGPFPVGVHQGRLELLPTLTGIFGLTIANAAIMRLAGAEK